MLEQAVTLITEIYGVLIMMIRRKRRGRKQRG